MARVLPLRKAPQQRFTRPQERIWAVLQEEEHRILPIHTICEMAGYRSVQIWYHVMNDEAFRAQVEALGVLTRRQGVPLRFQPVIPLTTNAEEEWQKDVIDIRRLVIEYPKHWPASCFKLKLLLCSEYPDEMACEALLSSTTRILGTALFQGYVRRYEAFLLCLRQCPPKTGVICIADTRND